jgi:hypothetical protein
LKAGHELPASLAEIVDNRLFLHPAAPHPAPVSRMHRAEFLRPSSSSPSCTWSSGTLSLLEPAPCSRGIHVRECTMCERGVHASLPSLPSSAHDTRPRFPHKCSCARHAPHSRHLFVVAANLVRIRRRTWCSQTTLPRQWSGRAGSKPTGGRSAKFDTCRVRYSFYPLLHMHSFFRRLVVCA